MYESALFYTDILSSSTSFFTEILDNLKHITLMSVSYRHIISTHQVVENICRVC